MLKRIFCVLIFVLLLPGVGWGANYYVSTTGSNTSPYDTEAKGATAIKTVIDYIRSNGTGSGDVVYIGAGTFSSANDYILLNHANLNNLTIHGAGRTSTVVSPTASHAVQSITATGNTYTITDITLTPPIGNYDSVNTSAASTTLTLNDVDCVAPDGNYDYHVLYFAGGVNVCNRVRVFHVYYTSAKPPVNITGGDATFNYCQFTAKWNFKGTQKLALATTGTVNLNNCMITGSVAYAVQCTAAGTFNINNCLITGGTNDSTIYPVGRTSGTLTVTNTQIIANPQDGDTKWITGTYTDGGGNLFLSGTATDINAWPKHKAARRKGYLMICVDDGTAAGFTLAQAVETSLSSRGFHGTYSVDGDRWVAGNTTALQTMASNGTMSIASHTMSHSDLSLADGTALINIGTGTVTVNRGTDTISYSGGGSVTGFKAKTLAAIKTELDGLGANTSATAAYGDQTVGKIGTTAKGEVLKDGTTISSLNLLIDSTAATGLFKAEMVDAKSWLETLIGGGYTCYSLTAPYDKVSTESRTASMTTFQDMRGGPVGAAIANALMFTNKVDLYSIYTFGAGTMKGDGTEAATRKCARALAYTVAQTGYCVAVVGHSTDMTSNQFEWFIDELSAFGSNINVVSLKGYRDAIVAGWTDNADGTYSKTGSVNDGDYHITDTTSTLYQKGTNLSLTTDYFGRHVHTTPNIGLDDTQGFIANSDNALVAFTLGGELTDSGSGSGGSGMSLGLGLTGGNYPVRRK